MILVDTSIIVAWLDKKHPQHQACTEAVIYWAGKDRLAVSSVTYGELAAGGRTREAVDEDLSFFQKIDLNFDSAWLAGHSFGRTHSSKEQQKPVLPDFLIRAQAASLDCRHLTCDKRRLASFPQVDFLFPEDTP